ncbi:MAG: response regulator [Acidobacteria bacterium]|nr:response regulator [Acidobacteriota bacterium]
MGERTKLTILLAEDHADSREMLAVMLEMDGFRVIRAADGVEALGLARANSPDLVITDVNMPLMNGIDLIRSLRAGDVTLANVPIVAISALGSSCCLDARDAGANEAIAKPLGYDQIREVVGRFLHGSH